MRAADHATPLRSTSDRLLNALLALAVFAGVWLETVFRTTPLPGVNTDGGRIGDEEGEGFARFDDPIWHEWGEHGATVPLAALAAVALPAAVSVLIRQRWPIPAVVFSGAAALAAVFVFGIPVIATLAFAVVLYSVAVERGWFAAALPAAAAAVTLLISTGDDIDDAALLLVLAILVAIVTPLLAAAATRSRRDYLSAMQQQLHQARAEQLARTEQALAQERVKLAHDLHDVLAHSLTVVNMQVGVASHLLAEHPERARIALDEAHIAGNAAIAELRNTLALLRGAESDQLAPQPSLADLNALFVGMRATGMPLTVHVDVPDDLPPSTSLVAYRGVQEGLTNVVKHAGPTTPTAVEVTHDAGTLHIAITNDAGTAGRNESPGIGLEGLRTRVVALGGSFTAGPTPAGGFALTMAVPITAPDSTEREVHP